MKPVKEWMETTSVTVWVEVLNHVAAEVAGVVQLL